MNGPGGPSVLAVGAGEGIGVLIGHDHNHDGDAHDDKAVVIQIGRQARVWPPLPRPARTSNRRGPLIAVSQTEETEPDYGVRSGRRAGCDLRQRILPHWPDWLL